MIKLNDKLLITLGSLFILYGVSGITVMAQTSQSSSYMIDETYIGPGGSVDSSSAHFRESSTAGDIGTGDSSSTNFKTKNGFNTSNEPRLSVIVNTSSINFGQLSTAAATTATSSFSVLNYTAHGYSVFTIGNPPDNGGHTLAGMSSAAASQNGVEQYGINLVANTSPVTFGADAVQVPDSSYSFGEAASGYDTTNNFKYVPGEEIAKSVKSSGQTNFTISYIVNASNNTPGGTYSGSQSLVVVGTY